MKLMEKVIQKLPLATLMKFEGADHSFQVGGRRFFWEELVTATVAWIDAILGQ